MSPFWFLDVNLFFTVLSRVNPKGKKINVKKKWFAKS